jgi:hypothetical protein
MKWNEMKWNEMKWNETKRKGKGRERKGKERKGKERKGKERNAVRRGEGVGHRERVSIISFHPHQADWMIANANIDSWNGIANRMGVLIPGMDSWNFDFLGGSLAMKICLAGIFFVGSTRWRMHSRGSPYDNEQGPS